jgi:large subunit ribosomal protein L7/L12
MSKVDKIIDQLKEITLLEASELVTAIEETFGVSAAAPVAVAGPAVAGAAAPAEAAVEKSTFNVKVTEYPADKKIAVIKEVKNILNIGLAEAKTQVEGVPFTLAENVAKEDANKYKDLLTAAGAVVILD